MSTSFLPIVIALLVHGCDTALSTLVARQQQPQRLWRILEGKQQTQAWKTIFGDQGERGEYMDGYSEEAMFSRCQEDYKWSSKFAPDAFPSERAKMVRANTICGRNARTRPIPFFT